MKTQHTPGPWTVDNQYIHGPDGIRFLAVAGDGAGQANARLIASAPELLAALERSEEGLRCLLDEVALLRAGANPEPQSASIRTYALIQARAAIARATTGGNAS